MIEIKELIGAAAVILGLIGYVPYILDILRGTTRPHVYTWFVWGVIGFVIFALQYTAGAGPGAWVGLVMSILSFLVCALGLRHGKRDITYGDTAFLIVSLIALGCWLLVDQPVLAMVLLVVTSILSFIPTVRKSWHDPHSETLTTYITIALRHLLSFFAITNYSILTWLFPVTFTITNLAFIALVVARRHRLGSRLLID